jgi:CubicO group peptidase (beta-lactamase class C family)
MRLRSLLSASLLSAAAALSGCAPAPPPPEAPRGGQPAIAPARPADPPEPPAPAESAAPAPPAQAPAPQAGPPELPRGEAATDLDGIDAAVKGAIARHDTPGAVVAVVRDGAVVFERAYGLRSKEPDEQPMTVDTVFDLGSLTKPIATAPSILLLAQQGKLAISDPVTRYLPGFGQNGKGAITIEELLLHTSGLTPDNHLRDYEGGAAKALERIDALGLVHPPGAKFDYSDVGYIVLGALVERVSGEPLGDFAREHLYEPLGMRDTAFAPGEALAGRAASTALRDGRYLKGEAHDERAARLGGVAGHAGLFTTAADLARFALMLMNGGELGGVRIFDAATVARMTAPHPLPGGAGTRGLGWDIQTSYSGNRGSLPGGYGHSGFTGTSIWLVPDRKAAVIILSNRLHPDGKGSSSRLRREVAGVVARSLEKGAAPAGGQGG